MQRHQALVCSAAAPAACRSAPCASVWPGSSGQASVIVPVVTTSPRRIVQPGVCWPSRRPTGAARAAGRRARSRPAPLSFSTPSPCSSTRSAARSSASVGQSLHRHARADEQPAVQGEVGHRVGRREAPVVEVRVHDLEAVRHPGQASLQFGQAHAGVRRAREAEHDLGLEPRLRERGQRHVRLGAGAGCTRAVPHRAPDRRVHAVALPDAAVGEADLPAHRRSRRGRCAAGAVPRQATGGGQVEGRVDLEAAASGWPRPAPSSSAARGSRHQPAHSLDNPPRHALRDSRLGVARCDHARSSVKPPR